LLRKIEHDEALRAKEVLSDEELERKDAPLDDLLNKLQGSIHNVPIKVTPDEQVSAFPRDSRFKHPL
jgi:hypothetical protein